MRHHVDGRKLGRTTAHRKAMFANMMSSLILHDRIETTLPKAKELRRYADRLVTLGKRQTIHARRRAVAMTRNKTAVRKLFDDIARRFVERNGGYTRIYKLGFRHGDSAPMAIIEYLPHERESAKEEKAPAKKAKSKLKIPGRRTEKKIEEKPTKEAKGKQKAAAKESPSPRAKAKKKSSKKSKTAH